MRSFVDLGLFLSAVALGIGSFLPVLAGARPTEIPLTDLRDGIAAGDVSALGAADLPVHQTLAAPLVLAAVLLLLAALFDSAVAGWAGVVLGLVATGAFAVRVHQRFDDYVRANHATALTNQTGFVLLLSGLGVALLCAVIAGRRTSA
ncbi:hypothetical protein [Rhodococcus indonesiensis]